MKTVDSPYVDGTYTDDVQGLPEEHAEAAGNLGMEDREVRELRYATQRTSQKLIRSLVEAKKYNWQAFGFEDNLGPAVTKENCVSFLRSACNETTQHLPWTVELDEKHVAQSVAAFLIGRGPYAYIGYGWLGEYLPRIHPLIEKLDVGQPIGLCREEPKHVFTRDWTKGSATLRCDSFVANLFF